MNLTPSKWTSLVYQRTPLLHFKSHVKYKEEELGNPKLDVKTIGKVYSLGAANV